MINRITFPGGLFDLLVGGAIGSSRFSMTDGNGAFFFSRDLAALLFPKYPDPSRYPPIRVTLAPVSVRTADFNGTVAVSSLQSTRLEMKLENDWLRLSVTLDGRFAFRQPGTFDPNFDVVFASVPVDVRVGLGADGQPHLRDVRVGLDAQNAHAEGCDVLLFSCNGKVNAALPTIATELERTLYNQLAQVFADTSLRAAVLGLIDQQVNGAVAAPTPRWHIDHVALTAGSLRIDVSRVFPNPPAPQRLRVTSTTVSTADIAWDAPQAGGDYDPSRITAYVLHTRGASLSRSVTLPASARTYRLANLAANSSYVVSLLACVREPLAHNRVNCSIPVFKGAVTPPLAPIPPRPTNLRVVPYGKFEARPLRPSVKLAWSAAAGEWIELLHGTPGSPPPAPYGTPGRLPPDPYVWGTTRLAAGSTTYTYSFLSSEPFASFEVRACSAGGCSSGSNRVWATRPPPSPVPSRPGPELGPSPLTGY